MKIIVILFCFLLSFVANTQELRPDSIYRVKNDYYRKDRVLEWKKCSQLLLDNEASKELFIRSRNSNKAAQIFGGIGGFCLGYYVGYLIAGDKRNPAILVGGGASILLSIPFSVQSKSLLKKSIKKFNQRPKSEI